MRPFSHPTDPSSALRAFCTELMASVPLIQAPERLPEVDPEEEYNREHGVMVCPWRWVDVTDPGAVESMESPDDDAARAEPFCACGRIVSRCDGSRRGCWKGPVLARGEAA
jgi:hypothetical protein